MTSSSEPLQRANDATGSTVATDAPLQTSTKSQPQSSSHTGGPRTFLHRLHVVAGIFVAPLLLVAAITGMLYAVAPSLEKVIYHDEMTASSTAINHTIDEQVAAAKNIHPNLEVSAVQVPEKPGFTTRVMFKDDTLPSKSYRHAVFVDPSNLQIKGDLVQYGSAASLPFRAWVSEGHKRLWLGEPGRLYSETAASWMGALTIGGLWLWFTRKKKNSNSAHGKQMKKHANLGIWLAAGMLFLTATGLTWSLVAGSNISAFRESMNWYAPKPETVASQSVATIDEVVHTARADGLTGKVEVTIPEKGEAWVVKEAREEWRTGMETSVIDGNRVVEHISFKDWPLAAKLAEWTINAHMGILFGWVNQLILVAIAVGLIVLIVRGYMMWYLRGKGKSFGRLPGPTRWRDMDKRVVAGLLAAVIAYSIIAPLFGITLVGFVLIDTLWRKIATK